MAPLFLPLRPTTVPITISFPPISLRRPRRHLKFTCRSFGDGWKLPDIDRDAVQKKLTSWLARTRVLLNEVAVPLVIRRPGKSDDLRESEAVAMRIEEAFVAGPELTVNRRTPMGELSLAAVISIEQFARMNGLTGSRMQKIFRALAPEEIQDDGRSLVEYCCFRFLSKDTSNIHPFLKESAFQRLIFISMLAWQQPYSRDGDSHSSLENSSLQDRLVREEAFIRIAPAISGVADRSTVHHLFKALVGEEGGISLKLWSAYISELVKVHRGRESNGPRDDSHISMEKLLCMSSSRKRPVLKWEENIAWPGNLTLTDRALYFEAIDLTGLKPSIRLDLTEHGSRVEKTKVGPFGSKLFDSAVAVSSGDERDKWVLEFVDFGGETRRDVWYAFIKEIISLYDFLREYGPDDDDSSIWDIYGANKGRSAAINSVASSIARLQALQFIRKLSEDPAKLVQFSYLRTVPYGDIVLQTLAVNIWGGPSLKQFKQEELKSGQLVKGSDHRFTDTAYMVDIDGSVYLRKWMRSSSWTSNSSINFWKYVPDQNGIVLSKNLIVGDLNLVERAAAICKEKSHIVEKTQASIDAAMIKGIPSNIDLFKELMLPLIGTAKNFEKLRRWEDPWSTLIFLTGAYTVIFRNMLSLVFPLTLMAVAIAMLLLKGLREQGRLGRSFARVTIRDQPPSNTIQKIIAVKEAMADLETSLQSLNITLLKIRTILLSGQPEITNRVAVVLLGASITLLAVPFKYILAFFLFDIFTRELEFRRDMVQKFRSFLSEQWASVHAAPVAVLPYEGNEAANGSANIVAKESDVSDGQKKEKAQNKKKKLMP